MGSPLSIFVAEAKKKKKKSRLTRKVRDFCLNLTIRAVKEIDEGKTWVWVPYGKILAELSGHLPSFWDSLIFLQSLGWEKTEIGGDKFLVLRKKNVDYTKEILKDLVKAIQRKVSSR